jgi:hypothetical protein
MRRNSSFSPAYLFVLATLLALALTLAFAGTTSAAPVPATLTQLPAASTCLSATPAIQQVQVAHPASVLVTVHCFPVPTGQLVFLLATWQDGTTTRYPVCVEVCRVPPFTILTSHTYTKIGVYHPTFCLTSGSVVADCTSVEILVHA